MVLFEKVRVQLEQRLNDRSIKLLRSILDGVDKRLDELDTWVVRVGDKLYWLILAYTCCTVEAGRRDRIPRERQLCRCGLDG